MSQRVGLLQPGWICQHLPMAIFRRRPKSDVPTSTGHAGDDELLAQIAAHSDLKTPRHWVHYLYCSDEPAARKAAAVIELAGWQLQRVDEAAEGHGWVVIAERFGAVTTPEAVQAARSFFEGVASTVVGGDYDGWEVSL